MLTENGTIKVETPLDANVQKEFMHKLFIVSLVCLIVGSVGIVGYFVWDIISVFLEISEPHIVILIVVAAAFAFGLIFVISCNKVIKKARTEDKKEVYEFFNNYFITQDYFNGELVATVKFYYNRVLKIKETKSYLFVYVQPNAALPLGKANMTEAELNAVRALLGMKTIDGNIMKLPDGADDNAAQPLAEKPEDKEN